MPPSYFPAIKTGRYTHEKRTMDTMEVRGEGPPPTENGGFQPDASTSHMMEGLFSNGCWSGDYTNDQVYADIITAFRNNFVDTSYMYGHMEDIENMVHNVMKENGMDELTHVIAIAGDGADHEVRRCQRITEQVGVLLLISPHLILASFPGLC